MASGEYEFTIKWSNGDFFEMTCTPSGEDLITVVRVEENGRFANQQGHIRDICHDALNTHLHHALTEMSA